MKLALSNKNKKLLKSSKPIGILVGLVVLLILLFTLLLKPQYSEFGLIMAERERIEQELSNVDQQTKEVEALFERVNSVSEAQKARLSAAVPFTENTESFLANIDRLSQQSGLLILNMYVEPENNPLEESELKKLQINISLRGTYENLLTFLGLVERHIRIVDINNISILNISSSNLGNTTELLQVQLNGFVYYLETLPDSPLFPYGRSLDLSLFDLDQFQTLQLLSTSLPVDITLQPNPFTPR